MAIVNVNGSPIVYNNATVFINGSPDGEGINGWIKSINYRLGSSSTHNQALSPNGDPLQVSRVNSAPTCELIFIAGAATNFWELMGSRNVRFDLSFSNFATGDMAQSSHTCQLQNVMLDDSALTTAVGQPESIGRVTFNATKINF